MDICSTLFAVKCGPGATFGNYFDSKIRRDHGNFFYERCVYESVDDKCLFRDISQKSTENRIFMQQING